MLFLSLFIYLFPRLFFSDSIHLSLFLFLCSLSRFPSISTLSHTEEVDDSRKEWAGNDGDFGSREA